MADSDSNFTARLRAAGRADAGGAGAGTTSGSSGPVAGHALGAGLVRRGRRRRARQQASVAISAVAILALGATAVVDLGGMRAPIVSNPIDSLPTPAPDKAPSGADQPSGVTTGDEGDPLAGASAGPGGPADPVATPLPTDLPTPGPSASPSGQPSPQPSASEDGTNGGATDTGITSTTVTITALLEQTGATPGDWPRDAEYAMEAFALYAQEELAPIHGRRLVVRIGDTRYDPNSARQSAREACDDGFAIIGSDLDVAQSQAVTSFARSSGCPDLRGTLSYDPSGQQDRTHRVNQQYPDQVALAPWWAWADRDADAVSRAAWIADDHFRGSNPGGLLGTGTVGGGSDGGYGDWVARVQDETTSVAAYDWRIDARPPQGDTSWYASQAQAFREQDIQFAHLDLLPVDAIRFVQKLDEQDAKPRLLTLSPELHQDALLSSGGPSFEGVEIALDHLPWTERDRNAMIDRYLTWLGRLDPEQIVSQESAPPTSRGLHAWAAAERLVEDLRALGAAPTREDLTARWDAATRWNAGGAIAPRPLFGDVGQDCFAIVRADTDQSRWVRGRGAPGSFTCR